METDQLNQLGEKEIRSVCGRPRKETWVEMGFSDGREFAVCSFTCMERLPVEAGEFGKAVKRYNPGCQ